MTETLWFVQLNGLEHKLSILAWDGTPMVFDDKKVADLLATHINEISFFKGLEAVVVKCENRTEEIRADLTAKVDASIEYRKEAKP